MTVRVAINGYGRIGRNVLRALYENGKRHAIDIIAINDLGDTSINAHLTRFDSVHGAFAGEVSVDDGHLVINGDRIRVLAEKDPARLPWKDLAVDIVLECTGHFTSAAKARAHLDAGAGKVLISAPGTDVDATVVFGVNQTDLRPEHRIISNASCTTNCLAPMAAALHKGVGIIHGCMTTIHSFTNDQVLIDVYHPDLRRARSAHLSMIPTKTGAAAAVGLVLPALKGKLDGLAVRVPTTNVSLVDLVFDSARNTSVEEINALMKAASVALPGVLDYNDLPLVSVDFNHNPASCIFDSTQTRVHENLVKVMAWYDNEWGFSCRMLDICHYMGQHGLV